MKRGKRELITLSKDPADKVMACLDHGVRRAADEHMNSYFAACGRWWEALSPQQRDKASLVIEHYEAQRHEVAEKLAASLPSAPKYPR